LKSGIRNLKSPPSPRRLNPVWFWNLKSAISNPRSVRAAASRHQEQPQGTNEREPFKRAGAVLDRHCCHCAAEHETSTNYSSSGRKESALAPVHEKVRKKVPDTINPTINPPVKRFLTPLI
jgi:hypothetical protein